MLDRLQLWPASIRVARLAFTPGSPSSNAVVRPSASDVNVIVSSVSWETNAFSRRLRRIDFQAPGLVHGQTIARARDGRRAKGSELIVTDVAIERVRLPLDRIGMRCGRAWRPGGHTFG